MLQWETWILSKVCIIGRRLLQGRLETCVDLWQKGVIIEIHQQLFVQKEFGMRKWKILCHSTLYGLCERNLGWRSGKFCVIQISCKGEKEAYCISNLLLTICKYSFGLKRMTFSSMWKWPIQKSWLIALRDCLGCGSLVKRVDTKIMYSWIG